MNRLRHGGCGFEPHLLHFFKLEMIMSSDTKFKCDFCRGVIVKACKNGARGYCVDRDDIWSMDPYKNLGGPHICEECIGALLKSIAFNKSGM